MARYIDEFTVSTVDPDALRILVLISLAVIGDLDLSVDEDDAVPAPLDVAAAAVHGAAGPGGPRGPGAGALGLVDAVCCGEEI